MAIYQKIPNKTAAGKNFIKPVVLIALALMIFEAVVKP